MRPVVRVVGASWLSFVVLGFFALIPQLGAGAARAQAPAAAPEAKPAVAPAPQPARIPASQLQADFAVLKRALVLIDSRHGLKDVDRDVMKMLDDAAVSYHLVLTKGDKVKPTELAKTLDALSAEAAKHPAAHPIIFTTSSETGSGIAELRTAILEATTA